MIKLGMIGTGGMANAQATRYEQIKGCKLVACCDIVPGRAQAFADKYGATAAYTDAEEMFDKEKLDAVSVVTPDSAHCEPTLLAIKKGIPVMCEKPLADNLKDAKQMAQAAAKKKLITAVNFSYRNAPATQKAAQLVTSGRLGRIIHVEGSYLQCWLTSLSWGDWRKTDALLWRLSSKHGSMGTLGDIGVHLYDLASFVVDDIVEIDCTLKIFPKKPEKIRDYVFDVNDSLVASVKFANGALGTLHSSRWATGHINTVALRVYGEKGAIDLNLDRPQPEQLLGCLGKKNVDTCNWEPVTCPAKPDMYQRFITAVRTGEQGQTSFEGAARVQAYLHYSVESHEKGGYVKVK